MFNNMKPKCFTMAEVLITLGIIGIIAAMTLPSVIEGYKKKETIAKLQKAYSILNQAFRRSQIDNSDYQYWAKGKDIGIENFYNQYWYPYFQITTVCKTHEACGYTSRQPWSYINGNKAGTVFSDSTLRIPFITADGILYSISIATGAENNNTKYFSIIYVDINGAKSPNKIGIDVFLFVPIENNIIMPHGHDRSSDNVNNTCRTTGETCAAKIMSDGWDIKKDYPWK